MTGNGGELNINFDNNNRFSAYYGIEILPSGIRSAYFSQVPDSGETLTYTQEVFRDWVELSGTSYDSDTQTYFLNNSDGLHGSYNYLDSILALGALAYPHGGSSNTLS